MLLYEEAALIQSVETDEALGVTFTSSDGAAKIKAAYVEFFDSEGWSREALMQIEGMSMLTYKKGKRSANLHIIEAENEPTQVSLNLSR